MFPRKTVAATAIAMSILGGTLVAAPAFAAPSTASASSATDVGAFQRVDITSPEYSSTVDAEQTITVSGTGQIGAQIGLRSGNGTVVAKTTVQRQSAHSDTGTWTAKLPVGSLTLEHDRIGVIQTSPDGRTSQDLIWVFTSALSGEPANPMYGGGSVNQLRPSFRGESSPNSKIVVSGSTGRVVATATADASGEWTTKADFDLTRGGRYTLNITETRTSGSTNAVKMSTFTVLNTAR